MDSDSWTPTFFQNLIAESSELIDIGMFYIGLHYHLWHDVWVTLTMYLQLKYSFFKGCLLWTEDG